MKKRYQWLLHAGILTGILLLVDVFDHYQLERSGGHLFHEDGSVVSLWDRIRGHLASQGIAWMVLAATGVIEWVYHRGFRKGNLLILGVLSLLTGLVLTAGLLAYNTWRFGVERSFPWEFAGLVAGYTFLYAVVRDYFRRLVVSAQEKAERTQAELTALRSQVDPHFLFNTLNMIYGTALKEKAPETADHIEQLAGMLRYVLIRSESVPVEAEKRFLEEYLALQRKRIPAGVRLDVSLPAVDPEVQIAPLLLIPFVENAFRYGISAEEPSFIRLELSVRKGRLDFFLLNSIHEKSRQVTGEGTGIRNTLRRLELLYPDRHTSHIGETPEGFRVALTLHL